MRFQSRWIWTYKSAMGRSRVSLTYPILTYKSTMASFSPRLNIGILEKFQFYKPRFKSRGHYCGPTNLKLYLNIYKIGINSNFISRCSNPAKLIEINKLISNWIIIRKTNLRLDLMNQISSGLFCKRSEQRIENQTWFSISASLACSILKL